MKVIVLKRSEFGTALNIVKHSATFMPKSAEGKEGKEVRTELIDCAYCEGSGRDPDTILTVRPCPVCKGKGKVWV